MGYNLNLHNKTHYQETGEYLVHSFSPNFVWKEVVEKLKLKISDEIMIVSYHLPFKLDESDLNAPLVWYMTGLGEMIERIEGTVYAKYFKEILTHFFDGNGKKALENIESIRFYSGHDLSDFHHKSKAVKTWLTKHRVQTENIEEMLESVNKSISSILMVDEGIFVMTNEVCETILECILNII